MFEVGQIYKRRDIHVLYGGQAQSGISTPKEYPIVLIFTGDSGGNYGYKDQFLPDGTFIYTGQGQVGDMEMTRGNLVIRDHIKQGKELHIFEQVKKGYVRYVGQAMYLEHHIEQRPDREGNFRNAIVFHLAMLPDTNEPIGSDIDSKRIVTPKRSMSLSELREIALQKPSNIGDKVEVKRNVYARSEAVKLYALKRAKGVCEGCTNPAPFKSKTGPFLEVHHVSRRADGGPDHPEHVIALCPNCHRRVHYGVDGDEYNCELKERLKQIER